jgi:drug/metabolite transporter (DMT)-like permease
MAPRVTSSSSLTVPAAPRLPVDLRLIAALAAVYVIWGSTYFAMRVAVTGLPPLVMGAARFTFAGLVLVAIETARGAPPRPARQWLHAVPVGVLFFVGGNGFVAIAVESIDSGVAAVVAATMPLWVAVLASVAGERPSGREWIGLVLGFAGVVVLLGGASLDGDPVHAGLLVLAPLSWALGSILARRLTTPAGLAVPGMQMVTGGVALAAVAFARGERPTIDAPADAWLALGYLVVFGSLVAFSAYAWLLRNARPAVATSYAYVNPVIAVMIGGIMGGELLDATTILATGLIVGAVALVVTSRRAPR